MKAPIRNDDGLRNAVGDARVPALETKGLTHYGADREADAHLPLEASDDILRLQPLAGHQHLFWTEQHRHRPEHWHHAAGAVHARVDT